MFFLLGLVIPFIFIKTKSKRIIWIPAILFFLGTIIMGVKARFSPGEGMAELGEWVYFMMFAVTTIGSIIGALVVGLLKK
jgi:hypothetical protein